VPGPDSRAKSTSFLDLPYELREQVYLCVHQLSCVYTETESSQPIWSCLASTCHQICDEMRDIPLRYLLKSIEEAWIDTGAQSPLLVTMSDRAYSDKRVTVLVPRCFLEFTHNQSAPSHLYVRRFTVLSALLHLHTNRVTLSLYDDGTPLLESFGHNVYALGQYLEFILDLLRARRVRGIDRFTFHSPMRQAGHMYQMKVVNTNEVVLLWFGFMEPLIPHANWLVTSRIWKWTCFRGGNIPQHFAFSGNRLPWHHTRMLDHDEDMRRLAITSSNGFRPGRCWWFSNKAVRRALLSPQIFHERFLSD
jgi:hypothetical protein